MPKLWDETIEAHRQSVQDATLETTARLVAERGLRGVTMSEIAEKTGIGRATLYKYFPDVETILASWHQRQIRQHIAHLGEVRDRTQGPGERLEAVLTAFAHIQRDRARHGHGRPHGPELAVLLHTDDQLAQAQHEVRGVIAELISDAATAGTVRSDISSEELAGYCIHALEAAGHAPSKEAISRLVMLTVSGMRPEREPG
jgi:AcrR family transcriptional regulator